MFGTQKRSSTPLRTTNATSRSPHSGVKSSNTAQRPSSQQHNASILQLVKQYFYQVGDYAYHPEIFLREYPFFHMQLRIVCSIICCASILLIVLAQVSDFIPYIQVVAPYVYMASSVAFAVSITGMLASFIGKTGVKQYNHPEISEKVCGTSAFSVSRFSRYIIVLGMCAIPLSWYFTHRKNVDWIDFFLASVIVWLLLYILLFVYRFAHTMLFSSITSVQIMRSDYYTRVLLATEKLRSASEGSVRVEKKPIPIDLVTDEEIAARTIEDNVLTSYIGHTPLNQTGLSHRKVHYLMKKISTEIDNMKIATTFCTILGGYITSQILGFEYRSILQVIHHNHRFLGLPQHIGFGCVIIYVTVVFTLTKIVENKNKALGQLDAYCKTLEPDEDTTEIAHHQHTSTLLPERPFSLVRRLWGR